MADNIAADAEATMAVVNITPDFCKVGKVIVPFDIHQLLPPELNQYSPDVVARDEKVLKLGSIVSGTIGNAGQGIVSGVSLAAGHSIIMQGDPTVLINGSPCARNLDLCLMNASL